MTPVLDLWKNISDWLPPRPRWNLAGCHEPNATVSWDMNELDLITQQNNRKYILYLVFPIENDVIVKYDHMKKILSSNRMENGPFNMFQTNEI